MQGVHWEKRTMMKLLMFCQVPALVTPLWKGQLDLMMWAVASWNINQISLTILQNRVIAIEMSKVTESDQNEHYGYDAPVRLGFIDRYQYKDVSWYMIFIFVAILKSTLRKISYWDAMNLTNFTFIILAETSLNSLGSSVFIFSQLVQALIFVLSTYQ